MKNEVKIKKWVKRGEMLYNTEALDYNDSDHPYNQIINQGEIPENFGIYHPLISDCIDMSREKLLCELTKERIKYIRNIQFRPGLRDNY